MFFRRLLLVLIIMTLTSPVSAGAYGQVKTFSRGDGLPGNRILSIFQDSDGIIWAGTDQGVGRYDGYQWRAFTVADGLAGPKVFSITQDQEGNLWFSTSRGICRFNGFFWDRIGFVGGLSGQSGVDALRDGEGRLWFGGEDGLFSIDPAGGGVQTIDDVHLKGITSLFIDGEGQLWLTAIGGVASYDDYRWKEYTENDGLPPFPILGGYQDMEGTYWFASRNGLVEFNGISFSTITSENSGLPSSEITAVSQDGKENLWVGTTDGPAYYDGYQWREPGGVEGWVSRNINALLIDSGENIWFGTEGGVVFLDTSWQMIEDHTHGMIPRHPFLETSKGIIWYAVRDGVESRDKRYIERWGSKDGYEGNLRTIAEDSEGNIWLGTDKGLYFYDGWRFENIRAPELQDKPVRVREDLWMSQRYRDLSVHQGLTGDKINAILEDGRGWIWVATEEGLSALDDRKWIIFKDIPAFQDKAVNDLAGEEEIWAATENGVLLFDGQAWRNISMNGGPEGVEVNTLMLAGKEHIWAGTEKGLWEYEKGEWKNYRQRDGLLSEKVTALARDGRGLLWIGTNAGISIFDGVNWSSLSHKDGLPAQKVLSLSIDKSGNLIVGGEDYLVRYYPDRTPPQSYVKNPPRETVGTPHYLFEFYGADLLTEPYDIRYSYRLDGGRWSPFVRDPMTTISEMGNGTHTFEVRSMDKSLNVDQTPAEVSFQVNTALFDVEVKEMKIKDLYASLYQHYASDFDGIESPVGYITLLNQYDRTLKVKISLIIQKFMDFSTDRIVSLDSGEEKTIPLRLELNDGLLSVRDNIVEQAMISLQYYIQGKLKENKFSQGVTIYGRNTMSWEDPNRICLYISHLDSEVDYVAKKVLSAGRSLEEEYILDNNFIRAVSLFAFVSASGMHYLPDPENPYAGIKATDKEDTLDYIRYPRETMMIKSGDCDDITVLYAALLQNAGIDAALVDVLDHVFLMFDTGLKGKGYNLITPDKSMVFLDEKDHVWIPVETTIIDRPFIEAWKKGAAEMDREPKNIIFVKEGWKTYQPVSWNMEGRMADRDKALEAFMVLARRDLAMAEDDIVEFPMSRLREELVRRPGDAGILNQMGIVLGKKGYFGHAKRYFDEVIRLYPDFAGGYSNLANVYYEKGEYQEAIELYRRSLELDPENTQVHVEIALTYAEMGDFAMARKHYLRAVKLDPDLGAASSN